MKRSGIINQPLSEAIAGLGHGDRFMLCDAGFPIPTNIQRIDLALCFGLPTMQQCIKAILDDTIVQGIEIASEMKKDNCEGYSFIKSTFTNQEFIEVPQTQLVEDAKSVKFIIRSGELGCYSNVIFESASGVLKFSNKYIIDL